MSALPPYQRRIQILRLIQAYGILSSSALQLLLKPKIDPRRLRVALERLQKRKLIYKRSFGPFRGRFHYYQLHPCKRSQAMISSIVKANNEELPKPQARFEDPMDCQSVAVWAERIKHSFPNAHVVPRVHFANDPVAINILAGAKLRLIHQAEMLVSIESEGSNRPVTILVSMDPWTGNESMPLEKIKLLAKNHQVDGILHIANDQDTLGQARKSTRQRWQDKRFQHYGDFFLVFTCNLLCEKAGGLAIVTQRESIHSMNEWVGMISSFTAKERRQSDSQFRGHPGSSSVS